MDKLDEVGPGEDAIRTAREFGFEMEPDNWFDCAHTHVDWDGVGNRSAAARRPFLEALFITFERLQQQALRCPHPYQSWIYIQDDDSSQDAVYFHTKSPNADNFPVDFSFVDFDIECPGWLADFVPADRYKFGRPHYNGVSCIYVFLK